MEQLRRPVPDLQLPIRLNGLTKVCFLSYYHVIIPLFEKFCAGHCLNDVFSGLMRDFPSLDAVPEASFQDLDPSRWATSPKEVFGK